MTTTSASRPVRTLEPLPEVYGVFPAPARRLSTATRWSSGCAARADPRLPRRGRRPGRLARDPVCSTTTPAPENLCLEWCSASLLALITRSACGNVVECAVYAYLRESYVPAGDRHGPHVGPPEDGAVDRDDDLVQGATLAPAILQVSLAYEVDPLGSARRRPRGRGGSFRRAALRGGSPRFAPNT